MQVSETLKDGLKRQYQIKVSAEELESEVNAKLLEAQPEVQMKGFRKGKVPMAMLKKQFGKSVLGEAMQESIDKAMQDHFEASGERPAMQPNITMQNGEEWKEGDDVVVDMSYEALPDIPEMSFDDVKLERMVVEADDAAIDDALGNLAETATNYVEKKGKSKDGDQVVFDFIGRVDGDAFEGGQAEDYPLVLGSNSFIPGFEDQLVGVKAGESKDVTVTFPEDYNAEALAGKEAVFECNIKEVKAAEASAIDDELAKKFGADDLAALKTQLGERLGEEYKGAARTILKRHLMDALAKKVSFELPPSLVESEAKQIAHQLWHEEHPEVQGHDHEEIEPTKEHTELAERRVRLGLLLAEVGQKAEIQLDDGEVQQALFQQARQYPGQERAFLEYAQKNRQILEQIRAPLFEDKVVDHILGIADIKDKPASKDDLQKALETLEDS